MAKGLIPILLIALLLPARPCDATEAASMLADARLQAALRHSMGWQAIDFHARMAHMAEPIRLRNGALFIEGWRDAPHGREAAALVWQDGHIHAALLDTKHGELRYFAPPEEPCPALHPAFHAWLGLLERPVSIFLGNTGQRLDSAPPRAPIDYLVDSKEHQHMRDIATRIWSASMVDTWSMGDSTGEALTRVFNDVERCHGGNETAGTPRTVAWAQDDFVATFHRHLDVLTHDSTQRQCLERIALSRQTTMALAAMDL